MGNIAMNTKVAALLGACLMLGAQPAQGQSDFIPGTLTSKGDMLAYDNLMYGVQVSFKLPKGTKESRETADMAKFILPSGGEVVLSRQKRTQDWKVQDEFIKRQPASVEKLIAKQVKLNDRTPATLIQYSNKNNTKLPDYLGVSFIRGESVFFLEIRQPPKASENTASAIIDSLRIQRAQTQRR